MKLVYICAPFRGPTAWDIECNVRRAEELGLEVAKLGAMPVIPHTNTRFFHGQLTDQFWLAGTKEVLRRCDAMIVMPKVLETSGMSSEIDEVARLRRQLVFYSLSDLAEWLQIVSASATS